LHTGQVIGTAVASHEMRCSAFAGLSDTRLPQRQAIAFRVGDIELLCPVSGMAQDARAEAVGDKIMMQRADIVDIVIEAKRAGRTGMAWRCARFFQHQGHLAGLDVHPGQAVFIITVIENDKAQRTLVERKGLPDVPAGQNRNAAEQLHAQ